MNELYENYKDDGLVVIGVTTSSRGQELMEETVEEIGIEYPVVRDPDMKSMQAYHVNSFPDYYLVDRNGVLRIADCANGSIDDAIRLLLSEK